MPQRDIIVIGASAGGFEAIKKFTAALPAKFNASIFIVWHISPDVTGVLPQVINRHSNIYAANAVDKEPILPGRIYIAPPDHHMLLEKDRVRVTHGPRENRFRPAIDPLFRSAAYHFQERVIGIILSGALDDGTAGLWAVKHYGGIAIVQDPLEAEITTMPESALREVDVDYCISVKDIVPILSDLMRKPVEVKPDLKEDDHTGKEIDIALQQDHPGHDVIQFGGHSSFSCPECNGVLAVIKEGGRTRYRCHTGHAFSAESLLDSLSENIENSLWNAVRGIEESTLLLNHVGDHLAEINEPKLAALYFKRAGEQTRHATEIREIIFHRKSLIKEEEVPTVPRNKLPA